MSASMTEKKYKKRRILLAVILCIAIALVIFLGFFITIKVPITMLKSETNKNAIP